MAKKTAPIGVEVTAETFQPLPDRSRELAMAIHSALSPLLDADAAKSEARDAAKAASDGAVNQREAIMAKLATLSIKGDWREQEITTALALATKTEGGVGNAPEVASAVASFKSEIKLATLPGIREQFHVLLTIRNEVWESEAAEIANARDAGGDAKAVTPVRKLWSRGYHALTSMLRLAKDGKLIETGDDLIDYAVANDPDHNPEKVKAKLDTIRKAVAQFYADFPVEDLGDMIDNLNELTVQNLTDARNKKLGIETRKRRGSRKSVAPAAAPAPVVEETEDDTTQEDTTETHAAAPTEIDTDAEIDKVLSDFTA